MEDIKLPILAQRNFIPIRITGKRNILHFVKTMFRWKDGNHLEVTLKSTQWNGIRIFKILTDREITPNLKILNAQLVTKNPTLNDVDFDHSIRGKYLTNTKNIKFNHAYTQSGYYHIQL